MKERRTMENGNYNQSEQEIIRKIEKLGGYYDPTSNLPLEDQLLICETIAESTPTDRNHPDAKWMRNVNVQWNGNDIRKRRVNFELTQSKLQAVSKLKVFNYRTPPKEIAEQLEILFQENPSYSSHWPYIAQTYTPRTINRVIHRMIKIHTSGRTILNPSAYFTELIKHRQKRKSL